MLAYAARFSPEGHGSSINVTFRDVPSANTSGRTTDEAVKMAKDLLASALSSYAEEGKPFPRPSPPKRGERMVFLSVLIQAKLALWVRMGELGINQSKLAKRLGVDRKAVRRLLKLDHGSGIEKVEAALVELGKRLSIEVDSVGR